MKDTAPTTTLWNDLHELFPDVPFYTMALDTAAFLPVGRVQDYSKTALSLISIAIQQHYGISGYFGTDPVGTPVFLATLSTVDDDTVWRLQDRLDRLVVEGHDPAYVDFIADMYANR